MRFEFNRSFANLLLAGLAIAAVAPAMAAPTQMRQAQRDASGILKVVAAPIPEPGPNQVRIRVHASTVNPFELRMIRNLPQTNNAPAAAPRTGPPPGQSALLERPGTDVAGIVDAVGASVTRLKVGDKVLGAARGGGGWSDYALTPEDQTARKPAALAYDEAAGLVTAGWAAVRVFDQAGVKRGDKVAVIGAAGGVGSIVVQLALNSGATVIGIASSKQSAYLKGLGVTQVVPYDKVDVASQVKNVDVVINTVTGQSDVALGYLRPGGRLASIAGPASPEKCLSANVECPTAQRPPSDGILHGFEQLNALADRGKLKIFVEKRFPLEQVNAALDELQAGHAQGKIVLEVVPGGASQR